MMIPTLAEALAARGYDSLTPVQEAVSDPALIGSDLLVSAQTGSGKTVGFGLAIGPTLLGEAARLGPADTPLALVIAPTRELALQVMRELDWLYAGAGARIATCVGGMDMRDEVRTLSRGAHIVVGTPGRLNDHLRRGSLDLTRVRAVVLDEADEMLDLGFREDLEVLLAAAPDERRTLMFSATVPPGIEKLATEFQRDAVRLKLQGQARQHADIQWQAVEVDRDDAEKAIINLLLHHDAQNAIVFANTRMTVARLAARFQNRGLQVVALSGELSQDARSHALQAMRDGRARVCVATDVAARGIDLPNLDLVIHAELPTSPDVFLHRSGRTGRAGRKGVAVAIVPQRGAKRLERLLAMAKVKAEWIQAPGAEEILRAQEERLLSDPLWAEEVSEAEASFAARLLERYPAEVIAAGWLRAHRRIHAAPEMLAGPEARSKGKDRTDFGPSAWIALSVGRFEQAEPRWLLPMILRSTGLERGDVGAIRVRDHQTFVQIAAGAVERLRRGLGSGGVIEQGIAVSLVEGEPDLGPRPDGPPSGGHGRKPTPHRGREGYEPRAPRAARAFDGEAPRAPRSDDDRPRPPREDDRPAAWAKPKRKPRAEEGGAPARAPRWEPVGPRAEAPGEDGGAPRAKPARKPGAAAGSVRSDKFAPGKAAGPRSKPAGAPGGKPAAKKGKPGGAQPPRRKG